MPNDRTRSGSPAADRPVQTNQVRPLRANEVGNTLADRLSPMADRVRQLNTKLGVRRYRVFLVHAVWSGPVVGSGVPQEVSRREILPTPKIRDMSSTLGVLRSFGLTEEGGITIDEISASFTEDDLTGKTPDLVDSTLPRTGIANGQFFWEVVEVRNSYPRPVPRRYTVEGVPMRKTVHWTVNLTKQSGDRARGQTFNRTVS